MKQKKLVVSGVVALVLVVATGLAAVPALAQSGWGVDKAQPVTGQWEQLNPGANRWYWFAYAGDGSPIEVRLETVPDESTGFVVWTPEQIRLWGLGQHVEPIGAGAEDPSAPGTLVWSGSFRAPGTYYVVVEHTGSQPGKGYYRLSVTGTGVSLVKPTPTPAPTPTKAPAKKAVPTKLTGRLVFQTTYGGAFYTIGVDGTGLRRITDGIDPVWSPNGDQIAFVRWREPRGVWVVNADGSGERRLFDWDDTRYPSWSSDGAEVVFSRQHRGEIDETEKCIQVGNEVFCFKLPPNPHYNLGIVRTADGSFYEPLPSTSERSLTPDWSPSGEQIVYKDVYGMYVQSADGQTRYQITDSNRDTSPVWSPDGKKVAFVRRQHDHWEIYVVDADGKNLKRLTTTPEWADGTAANSVSPAWSPDGSRMAFLTDRTGEWEIWVMGADGTGQRPLFKHQLDSLNITYSFNGERAISWTQ